MAIGRIPEPGTGIPESIIAAKGDLIVGTANDTPGILSVGTNGHTLVADSSTATGLAYAAPAAGGKVLQVVAGTTSTETTSTTTSFVDTNLTATITPSLATSKILVMVTQNGIGKASNNSENALELKLLRGATDIQTISLGAMYTNSALIFRHIGLAAVRLDEPATTSATTYKTQFRNTVAATNVFVQGGSTPSTIILMEIGA